MKHALALALTVAAAASGTAAVTAHAGSAGPRTTQAPEASLTLKVRQTRFGKILFAGNGRVLYGFTRDRRGGPSQCYGDCAAAWPVYYAPGVLTAGAGVKRSLLGTVK